MSSGIPELVTFSDFRAAVLGARLASLRTVHLDFPGKGILPEILGLVIAFGEDRRAFHFEPNSAGCGVRILDWSPTPIDMGEYGVVITREHTTPELEGARVTDAALEEHGDEGSLILRLDCRADIRISVAGDEVSWTIVPGTSEVVCCLTGRSIPWAEAVELRLALSGEEFQFLYASREALRQVIHESIPLHPDLWSEPEKVRWGGFWAPDCLPLEPRSPPFRARWRAKWRDR